MRILYFTRDYSPHDHRFLSALAQTRHTVFLLRLERRGVQLEDRALPPEIQQIDWRGGRKPAERGDYPALLADYRRVLRQYQPDVVHAGPVQSAAFLAALGGTRPLVTMSWGSDLLKNADRSRLYRWATRFTLGRSDVLVGDCRAVQDKAVTLGFPSERVLLFPWGVDLKTFSPKPAGDLRARLGWQDAFVLLSLRAWEPIYGVDVVVKAFAQIAEAIPQARLLLPGNGSQAAQIHALIQQYNLGERVHLAGQVRQDELPGYYRAADLYVSASHSDGSSVSLMEALASGLPALVSDIPGNLEWLTPGQEGWFFRDGDPADLAQGILRAYEARGERAQMGQAARRLAEQRANWDDNFQVLLSAYELARRRWKLETRGG